MDMDLADKNRDLGRDVFYETTVQRDHWPKLETDEQADVLVVGGGLAGLSCALDLAERGQSVLLLEAERLCGHATGRNGGQAITGYACGQAWLEKHLGMAQAKMLWQLSLSSMALMRERMEKYAIDCHPVWHYLTVADRPRKAQALLQESRHMQSHYGYNMRYVQKADLQQHIGSDRYVAGLLDPGSGHFNPLRYGLGIARAAAENGVRLHENSPALSMQRDGHHWLVRTDQAQVRARHVVLAGNCGMLWQSPQLAKRLHARIMPVGTYVVATEALSAPLANQLLPFRAAVCDNNFVLDYFRISEDKRMLFGGQVSYTTATPSRLTEVMRQRMVKVFPQLAHTRIDHTWGGFVDISRDRAPDWGRFADGVYHVQGFSGHGLAATTLAGRVVTQAILGDAQALSAFEGIRQSPFPGGSAWRLPLLVAGTSYFRLRDWLS
jgi:gamma-glutamylputrescine oxidase